MYKIIFMSQAQKDAKKLSSSGLKQKALQLIKIIQENPLQYPPEFEYLKGNMKGLLSRRINNIDLCMKYLKKRNLSRFIECGGITNI